MACGLLIAQSGTLADGSGLLNYSNNANCTWIIAPPAVSVITINFTEFSTQLGMDFVRVFQCTDISCSEQLLLAELSGTYSTVQDVTSTTGYMKVVFTSDRSVNYNGFSATWKVVSMFESIKHINV